MELDRRDRDGIGDGQQFAKGGNERRRNFEFAGNEYWIGFAI